MERIGRAVDHNARTSTPVTSPGSHATAISIGRQQTAQSSIVV